MNRPRSDSTRLQACLSVFAGVFFLDQMLKASHIAHNDFQMNPDALLGLGADSILASAGLLVLFIYAFPLRYRYKNGCFYLPLAITLAGIASNSYDRLTRGGIIDYIDCGGICVFNLADIAIALGAMIFIWRIIKE